MKYTKFFTKFAYIPFLLCTSVFPYHNHEILLKYGLKTLWHLSQGLKKSTKTVLQHAPLCSVALLSCKGLADEIKSYDKKTTDGESLTSVITAASYMSMLGISLLATTHNIQWAQKIAALSMGLGFIVWGYNKSQPQNAATITTNSASNSPTLVARSHKEKILAASVISVGFLIFWHHFIQTGDLSYAYYEYAEPAAQKFGSFAAAYGPTEVR